MPRPTRPKFREDLEIEIVEPDREELERIAKQHGVTLPGL